MKSSLTDDANAILLLCAFQGGEKDYQPLTVREYNQIATVLYQSKKCPGDLLTASSAAEIAQNSQIGLDRLQWLLGRRIDLGFRLEEWQRKGIWVLARSDQKYPKTIRKSMGNLAPPLVFGTGNQSLLCTGGLAIIGPDSIPSTRIKKACEVTESTTKQGQTVIAAGHLNLAKKIVQKVHECTGRVIWVLHDEFLRQRLKKDHRQAIGDNHLVMITAQSPNAPEKSGERFTVGQLAAGLADELLYVDGSNSKDSDKRADRFGVKAAALRRSEVCKLLHGRILSPEAQELEKCGIQLQAEPIKSQGKLFE